MSHWWVYSPSWMETVDVGLEDGCGPTETMGDAECVEACSGGEALAKALPLMKDWQRGSVGDFPAYGDALITFTVKSAECPHGHCFCDFVETCPWYAEECGECAASVKARP